ncbi:hypothetical protein ACFYO9_37685 [Streptomyces sp. NPDC005863]|uniref:hypothetical protein n=1 Tax=Streptomyces sp. NPDC005863 TaxID=3364735 RepID=UPI00367D7DC7
MTTTAEARLAQYGERTKTWSTATYDTGTERALHQIALELKGELDRLRVELAKYVGHEPTVAEEMSELARRLDNVHAVCDEAEEESLRWEHPLPVPEWVPVVREAADGVRPERKRRPAEAARPSANRDELKQRIARAIYALKSPAPSGSEHYRSGWDNGLEASIDAARTAVDEGASR